MIRRAPLLFMLLLISGCTQHMSVFPRTDLGQPTVMVVGFHEGCVDRLDTIDWGDGATTYYLDAQTHNYAFNGTYEVILRCGSWPYTGSIGTKYVGRAAVSTAATPPPSFFGLSGPVFSGIAALVTALVGAMTYLFGKRDGSK